jgi:predicted O-methyltransferase YrrM
MKDFIFVDNWLEKEYLIAGNNRYWTFKIALNLFLQRQGKIMVETGTTYIGDIGAGGSTVIFGKYLQKYGGKLYTVDLSSENIEACKRLTENWKNNIEYVVSDSHKFLNEFKDKIDFLYLDSYDYPLSEAEGRIEDCQLHQLEEFKRAENKLHDKSIVLLDDNSLPEGGKTRMTKEYLLEKGWICLMDYQQSLWIRN